MVRRSVIARNLPTPGYRVDAAPNFWNLVHRFINTPTYSRDTASCGRGSVCGFVPSRDEWERSSRNALPNF